MSLNASKDIAVDELGETLEKTGHCRKSTYESRRGMKSSIFENKLDPVNIGRLHTLYLIP